VITAKFDRPKLERSLKRASKAFGDTTAQAVCRWGVFTCRDLAVQTQAWGRTRYGKGTKKDSPQMPSGGKNTVDPKMAKGVQEGAMFIDALRVILIRDVVGPKNKKALRSAGEVNDWIEVNRTRRRGRTAKLSIDQRKVCTPKVFKDAMRIRFKLAGMAKGAWLGAGQDIAKAQQGADRINIGKGYLSWTQKHSRRGHGTPAKSGWSPSAILKNNAAHSASPHVVSARAKNESISAGLDKTVKWYNKALKAKLDKA